MEETDVGLCPIHRTGETMLCDPGPQQIEPLAKAAPVAVDIPRRQGLTLLELTSSSCHWPLGDPKTADFFFCGATTDVQPYCKVHRVVAYRAPAQPGPDTSRR
jgi:GcrA cell cycle regulator